MQSQNSILLLRQRELAESTREFKARGSKVIRCEQCLLPLPNCICTYKPVAAGSVAFCFLMYKGEAYKPSNTGRLIADVIADNYAFLWHRTYRDPALLALLADERYIPIVIFPHQYADGRNCIQSVSELQLESIEKKLLFIMLDGTWHEAKKMFKSDYLHHLPVLGIQPEKASTYLLRNAAHLHQLCTSEVAVEVLQLAGDSKSAKTLADYFAIFCQHYMVIKPHLLKKQGSE